MDLFGRKARRQRDALLTILRVAVDAVTARDREVERVSAALISQRGAIDRFMAGLSNLHLQGTLPLGFDNPRFSESGDGRVTGRSLAGEAGSASSLLGSSGMPEASAEIGSTAKLRFSAVPLYLSEQEEDIQYALDNELIDAKVAEDMLAQLNFDNAEITFDYEQI